MACFGVEFVLSKWSLKRGLRPSHWSCMARWSQRYVKCTRESTVLGKIVTNDRVLHKKPSLTKQVLLYVLGLLF